MNKLIKQQIFFAEAVNATPFGWKVMNYWDLEKSNFLEWNESSLKAFKKAVNFVKKEKEEIMERRKAFQKRRRGARGGLSLYHGEGFPFHSMARYSISNGENKDY